MKRDLLIGAAGLIVVGAICYGLTSTRHLQPPPPSPVPTTEVAASAPTTAAKPGNVVMRINGEPVTDREFLMFVQSLPQQVQAEAMSPEGRRQVAAQIVRLKLLEAEARRLGAGGDADVNTKMNFGRTNVYAEYALRKIASAGTEAAARAEYEKNKSQYAAIGLRHILIAYQGGALPARSGNPRTPDEAMRFARELYGKLKAGANFEQLADQYSDDVNSAQQGGSLGVVPGASLPPDIAAIVNRIPAGQISEPVRTQFGVHIFKVDSRQASPYEQVKPILQAKLQDNIVRTEVERLQKGAKVDLDPRFFGSRGLNLPPSLTPNPAMSAPPNG